MVTSGSTSNPAVAYPSRLGPAERAAAIAALKDTELDILVVGGGIVGTGSALDAVTRGLRVGLRRGAGLVASGTSSRSSKLVHGGIRYLEQLDFRLVREALIERGLLLQRIAPHLVKPVRFLYPLNKRVVERAYIGAGMMLYDIFSLHRAAGRPGVPHHRHLTEAPGAARHPEPRERRPRRRHHLLRRAGRRRALRRQPRPHRRALRRPRRHAASGSRASSRSGERVVGVQAHDLETGERFEIRAKQVVNATGVWTDDTQAMVGERGQFKVRASKGIHLVVPRDRFQSKMGLLLRTEKSVLFVIPWGRHWLIGTTDTDWHLDKAHPAATAADIDYLLAHVNAVLAVPLTREDVEGVYAGLRPLLAGESEETSKLSREHLVAHSVPGLVVIAGGKWTTYRIMAKDAIDAAVDALDGKIPRVTHRGHRAASAPRATRPPGTSGAAIARAIGLHVARIEHLLNRYGTLTEDSSTLIRERPRARRSAAGRRRLHRRRGRLRGHARGRAAPRGRARPPHPHLHRGLGPRRLGGAGRRAADGGRARLGHGRARSARCRPT